MVLAGYENTEVFDLQLQKSNLAMGSLQEDKVDEELKAELNSCDYFLVDDELQKGKDGDFIFAMSS